MRTRPIRSSSNLVPPNEHQSFSGNHAPAQSRGEHIPVLLHEVLDRLDVQPNDTVVDATLGGAGHAFALANKLGAEGRFVGFDADEQAIERAKAKLAHLTASTSYIVSNFRRMEVELLSLGITHVDKVLFDLGWSSYQLDSGRGFSFTKNEPLNMAYSTKNPALIAATIVNSWAEESLADVIFGWGGEHFSRRIARAIVERRKLKPFSTSLELAETIRGAVPRVYRYGKIHPATKTFQALRIAVNDEIGALTDGVTRAWKLLRPNGRVAVITFHSLEDRVVKELFRSFVQDGAGKLIDKKPLVPTQEEIRGNPRARSAKLRVIQKM